MKMIKIMRNAQILVSLGLVYILAPAAAIQTTAVCYDYWYPVAYKNICYKNNNDRRTLKGARSNCRSEGGNLLLVINTNAVLKDLNDRGMAPGGVHRIEGYQKKIGTKSKWYQKNYGVDEPVPRRVNDFVPPENRRNHHGTLTVKPSAEDYKEWSGLFDKDKKLMYICEAPFHTECISFERELAGTVISTPANVGNFLACQEECLNMDGCQFFHFTLSTKTCDLLDDSVTGFTDNTDAISGPKDCDDHCFTSGIEVTSGSLLSMSSVLTAWECYLFCTWNAMCSYFNYDEMAKTCELLDDVITAVASNQDVISGRHTCPDCFSTGMDIISNELSQISTNSDHECQLNCKVTPECAFFTYNPSTMECWLWDKTLEEFNANSDVVSGTAECTDCFISDTNLDGTALSTVSSVGNVYTCQTHCLDTTDCGFFNYDTTTMDCELMTQGSYTSKTSTSGVMSGPLECLSSCFEEDKTYNGGVLESDSTIDNIFVCQLYCLTVQECYFFVFQESVTTCTLHSENITGLVESTGNVAGLKDCNACYDVFHEYTGSSDLSVVPSISTSAECQNECSNTNNCVYFSWEISTQTCHLKDMDAIEARGRDIDFVSGKVDSLDCTSCFILGQTFPGTRLVEYTPITSEEECRIKCIETAGCEFFTYRVSTQNCLTKTTKNGIRHIQDATSADRYSLDCTTCLEVGFNYAGNDLSTTPSIASAADCITECYATSGCTYFSYFEATQDCVLKTSNAGREQDKTAISGSKYTMDCTTCLEEDTEYLGYDLSTVPGVASAGDCITECIGTENCHYFTYRTGTQDCMLKRREARLGSQNTVGDVSGSVFSMDCLICFIDNLDYKGQDNQAVHNGVASATDCLDLCIANPTDCVFFSYNSNDQKCRLKDYLAPRDTLVTSGVTSGSKYSKDCS